MIQEILILAANPTDTSRLRIDKEIRDIIEKLSPKAEFEIVVHVATRQEDMRKAILDVKKPTFVHFCGHGEQGGILLERENGQKQTVNTEALAKLFELCAEWIQGIILNACYSKSQAEAIAQHIPYVIGMNQAISDKAAIEFAVGFYEAVGAGKSIEQAYEFGCNALQWAGLSDNDIPTLITKNDVMTIEERSLATFIAEWIINFRTHPSIRKICENFEHDHEELGKKYLAILQLLKQLEDKKYLCCCNLSQQWVTLTKRAQEYLNIQLPNILLMRGQSDANPDGGEHTTDYPVDFVETSIITKDGCYLVRAKGDSMIDDSIHDNDFLVIEPIKPGELPLNKVVIARYNDGDKTSKCYVKRLRRVDDQLVLHSDNTNLDYRDIPITDNRFQIEGIVLTAFREII